MLAALRCPECTAPVRALPRAGDTATCGYCNASLTALAPAAEREGRREDRFCVVLRVAPSNIERIALLLGELADIPVEDTRARLKAASQAKCEIEIGANRDIAQEIVRRAIEGGARAELTTRVVVVPLWTVTLEAVGENKIAVIAALRGAVDFTVPEAKQLVTSPPSVVVTGAEEADARALAAALEVAGAKAVAQPS